MFKWEKSRAGTIRRLSPTIVAKCLRFNTSIPNHEKSILVTTMNIGKTPCYCSGMQSNPSVSNCSSSVSLFYEPINTPLNCNHGLLELFLTFPNPIFGQLQLKFSKENGHPKVSFWSAIQKFRGNSLWRHKRKMLKLLTVVCIHWKHVF